MADEPRVRLDLDARTATLDGEPVTLPKLQFDVLAYLAERPGRAVTREQIMREVWGTEWTGDTKTIDMHISLLRRKLGDDVANPRCIITVRGVGFRMEPGVVELAARAGDYLPADVAARVRGLCEQAVSGVAAGWVPAEVGKFATQVLAALEGGDE